MNASKEGLGASRRRWLPVAFACPFAAVALLGAPSPSQAAGTCSPSIGTYVFTCTTNSEGLLDVEIPAAKYLKIVKPEYADYEDCVWDVVVNFGDGSGKNFKYDAAEGTTVGHKYPTPGIYETEVALRNGEHWPGGWPEGEPSGEPCPNQDFKVKVTYPQPPKEGEPPGEEEPPPEEPPGEEPPPEQPGDQSGTPLQNSDSPEGRGRDGQTRRRARRYWRHCGAGVLVHRVRCRKARVILKRAGPPLLAGLERSVQTSGFSCHLRQKPKRRVACKQGGRRILTPPKGVPRF